MREKPRPQELYRHFKGNTYQILTLATDSESRREVVVYQALYGDYSVYVRELDMFMSEVDREKYPDATQKYRFEKLEKTSHESGAADTGFKPESSKSSCDKPESVTGEFVSEVIKPNKDIARGGYVRPDTPEMEKSIYMEKSVNEEAEELNLDPLVIEFMDADLAVDKNDILSKLRPTITNDMIDIMAMSLGVVIEEGDVYDRFNDLRTCLNTIEKFESTRLRS